VGQDHVIAAAEFQTGQQRILGRPAHIQASDDVQDFRNWIRSYRLGFDRIVRILDPERKCPARGVRGQLSVVGGIMDGMDSIFMKLLLDRIFRMNFVFRQFPDEIAETQSAGADELLLVLPVNLIHA
jgi:hypothetical protein